MTIEDAQVEMFKLFAYLLIIVIGLLVYEFYRILDDKRYIYFWKRFAFFIMASQLFSFLIHSIWNFATGSLGVPGIISRFWKVQMAFLVIIVIMWNLDAMINFARNPIKWMNDFWDKQQGLIKEEKRRVKRE